MLSKIQKHINLRAEKLFQSYPNLFTNVSECVEIISETHKKYRKHQKINRIIDFLILCDNIPEKINSSVVIFYLEAIEKRKNILESSGRHKSIIDLSLYEIFAKSREDALILYKNMVKNKTKKMCESSAENGDNKSINYHIRKYGMEEGTKIYQQNKESGRYKKSSNVCVEYYLERGFDRDEAIKIISERQVTFSLDKCIEKHGLIDGTEIWKKRQEKWQNTLKSIPSDEREGINKRKNNVVGLKSRGFSNKFIKDKLESGKRNKKTYFDNKRDFTKQILSDIEHNLIYDHIYMDDIYKLYPPKQFILLDIQNPIEFISNFVLVIDRYDGNVWQTKSNKRNFMMRIEEGFLRSSYEILFYRHLIDRKIKFELDNKISTKKQSW
jgi:hypothetical protein